METYARRQKIQEVINRWIARWDGPNPSLAIGRWLGIVRSLVGVIAMLGLTGMPDLSATDYDRSVREFTRLAAEDFRQSATNEQQQRAAVCRYFRRGAAEEYSQGELIDFLGVSSPSVLDMAGYSDEAALRVMEMLGDITDAEIQSTTLDRAFENGWEK